MSYILICALTLVGVVCVAVVIYFVLMAQGLDHDAIVARLSTDMVLSIVMGSPAQVVMLVGAWMLARQRNRSLRESLGLGTPSLTRPQWAWLLLASGVPFAISIAAATILPSMNKNPEALASVWTTLTPLGAVAWVLYIGLVPGTCEELFFRGAVQRRLLRSWPAPASILVTSVLFALLHVDPPAMALALVLGIWLGFVAWKTGSILPTMATHALINGGWNLANITVRQSSLPEEQVWIGVAILAAFSIVGFYKTVVLLSRRPGSPSRTPLPEEPRQALPASQFS